MAKQQTEKAVAKESGQINIPRVDKRVALIPIKGTSTLIVHAWTEKAKRQMRDKQMKNAKAPREAKDPTADFEGSKYRDAKGRDGVPVGAFRNAIISAGRFVDGLPMTRIMGSVFFVDDIIPIEFDKCVMREDMTRVGGKGPGTGTADLRYRAEYHGWKCVLRIEFNNSIVSLEQLVNLVQVAGFSVGVCEWRPERRGQHGRWDLTGTASEEKLAAA